MSQRRLPVGELRPSQLLYTYGVGAVVDLPHLSVMVMGLEEWEVGQARAIKEDRLLAQVQRQLGPQVETLCTPPMRAQDEPGLLAAFDDHAAIGVPVAPFPHWMRCPACHLLAPLSTRLFQLRSVAGRPDLVRYVHASCNRRRQPVVLPARFLLACEAGHLDDFPWHWFVHRGSSECQGALELRELGVSGEAADVEVVCRACESKRRMADAFGRDAAAKLPACRGRRPQLRDFEDGCQDKRQTILLGASNSWFPVTLSLLHVPARAHDRIARLVDDAWHVLGEVHDRAELPYLRRTGQLGALAELDDATLWQAICARRDGAGEDGGSDLKEPEWRVFAEPDPALGSADFQLRPVAPPARWRPWIDRVVLVERLREVTALTGFTRIASPRDFMDELEIPSNMRAPIARNPPRFVPASEVRGEGIFLRFDEARLSAWCDTRGEREDAFRRAHTAWRARRGMTPPEASFPGMRYIVLHSFAHALMRELALECGYTAASLRERIYAREVSATGEPMAGVLIYTAAPDSEGTLGGLVRMGRPDLLERHIARALEQIGLCSSDPLCADHVPEDGGRTLHGAVCHACLFAPETSCERGNKYLDRTALVDTLHERGTAFFSAAG